MVIVESPLREKQDPPMCEKQKYGKAVQSICEAESEHRLVLREVCGIFVTRGEEGSLRVHYAQCVILGYCRVSVSECAAKIRNSFHP